MYTRNGRHLSKRTVTHQMVDVDLDEYPLPEPDLPPESDGLLYISGRDYLEQLEHYRAYREGHNGGEHG